MRIEELDGAAANWRPWEPPTWLVAFGLVLTLPFGVAHAEKAGGRTGGTHEGAPTQPGRGPPPHQIPCAAPTPPPNPNLIPWFPPPQGTGARPAGRESPPTVPA